MEWPLLAGVPEDARRHLLASSRCRRFTRGEVAFHQGDAGNVLHLVVEGRFAVRMVTATGDTAILSLLGPGDFFGLLALLCDDSPPRTAGILSLGDSETLAIGAEDLHELRVAHPSVDDVLLRVLAQQVRQLTESLTDALYTPAETRVLRRLLDAALLWGGHHPGTQVPLTQEELGQLAGTTRATTNQALRQAEQLELVAIGRGKVTLVDPPGLARRAGVAQTAPGGHPRSAVSAGR